MDDFQVTIAEGDLVFINGEESQLVPFREIVNSLRSTDQVMKYKEGEQTFLSADG